jgi:L-histidine Nalpha-methyltransferase
VNVVNLLPPGFLENVLRGDVRRGLTAESKSLPSKWLYDLQGSALYEKIMKLREYYPARTECAILRDKACTIAALTGASTLIELGAGEPGRTRLLLDALGALGALESYVCVGVSESAVTAYGDALASEYPKLAIRPVVADFEEHLGLPGYPAGEPRLVALFGTTIGNMVPAQRSAFLARVRSRLHPGDAFLLGADLIKDPNALAAAYDDSAGVMAAFDKNILAVLNTRLGADFDLDAFDHVAVWVQDTEWIEFRLRSAVDQLVRVPGADLTVSFAAGEDIRTMISAKFRRDRLTRELAAAGLEVRAWWADPATQFAVALSVLTLTPAHSLTIIALILIEPGCHGRTVIRPCAPWRNLCIRTRLCSTRPPAGAPRKKNCCT